LIIAEQRQEFPSTVAQETPGILLEENGIRSHSRAEHHPRPPDQTPLPVIGHFVHGKEMIDTKHH